MRWCLAAALAFGALPGAARADAGVPGFRRIPHDFAIKVEAQQPDYEFWLVSQKGVERLELAPGRPFVVNGDGRKGSHRLARLVAAPAGLVESHRLAEFARTGAGLPAGAIASESVDFLGSVPFFDSRDRAVTRCRLEFVPGQHLRLVMLEENEGSRTVKGAWGLACVSVPVAILWGGWWVCRRLLRAADRPKT